MTETFTADQVRERLRKACDEAGGQRAFAEYAGVTESHISHMLRGRREVTGDVATALKLVKITRWCRLDSRRKYA